MRGKTQLSKVVSSHSSAWGASSFSAKFAIDSRSASCSSVNAKWRRLELKSGLRTLSAVAMKWTVTLSTYGNELDNPRDSAEFPRGGRTVDRAAAADRGGAAAGDVRRPHPGQRDGDECRRAGGGFCRPGR